MLLKKLLIKFDLFNTRLTRSWFYKIVDSQLRYLGDNVVFKAPFSYKNMMRLAIGNRAQLDRKISIDSSFGVMIGDDVRIGSGININTTINKSGSPATAPIFVGSGNAIDKDLYAGDFLPNIKPLAEGIFDKDLVFIVGTGRSGTKAIAKNLDKVKTISAYHDALVPLQFFAMDYFHGRIDYDSCKRRIAELFDFSDFGNTDTVVLSDHKYAAVISILHDLFPKARFIHLYRKADSFVNSAVNKGWFSDNEIENQFSLDVMNYNTYVRVNPVETGMHSLSEWKNLSAHGRNCWYWSFWNGYIEDQFSSIPKEQKITLRLEDLNNSLDRLSEFLKVKLDGFSRYNTSSINRSTTVWSTLQSELYKKYCEGRMMKVYGCS